MSFPPHEMGLARKGAIIALARLGLTSTEDHCPGALASYSIERDGTGQMVVGPYHYRNSAIKDVEPSLFTAVVWYCTGLPDPISGKRLPGREQKLGVCGDKAAV